MSTTTRAPFEPSAWMREAVARRLRQIGKTMDDGGVLIAPLGQPCKAGDKSDRTCDRCGTYVPPGPPFYVDGYYADKGILLVVGLCTPCRDLEVGDRT